MARKPADQSVSRREIIVAAADVLRENGYDATTMKDIAARVNLTAASLYHHFKSKDFLLLAVLELGLDAAIEEIEPIAQDASLSNADKLRHMIRTHILGVTSNTAFGAAMVFEIRSLMSAGFALRNGEQAAVDEFLKRRDVFFERRDYFEKLFRSIIEAGIVSGEFRQVDAGIVAKAMLGAHNWVGVWYKPEGRLDGDGIARIMSDTFLVSLLAVQEKAV